MKIVITGANGFVGASLCRYFSKQGHEVIATGRQQDPNAKLLTYATYIPFNIIKPIEYFNADVCIHAAGLATDQVDYDNLFLNNVVGTANVLEASKNCKLFIFISSSSVYNFTNKPAVEPDADLSAHLSDYGRTKLMAEELVKNNIPLTQQRLVLRPRAIYGIGDRHLLSRLLKLVRWQTIFYPADNKLQTSATHINNIAYAIELFFSQKDKPELQVFNIADDEIYSFKDITLKIVNAVEGRHLKVVDVSTKVLKSLAYISPKRVSPLALKTLTQNSVLDLSSIRENLNYKPLYDFGGSFEEIGEWVRNMGGKKVYLNNLDNAPWILNDKL